MATTPELPEAALNGLRDYLLGLSADEETTPAEQLDGISDSVLAAYWHGYVEASKYARSGQELHTAAFGASLFAPQTRICAETGDVRAALAQSFQ